MKTTIRFENSTDAGCPIEPEEMERYVSEVVTHLESLYGESAEIITSDSGGQTRIYVNGQRNHDLEADAQVIWESGSFWD